MWVLQRWDVTKGRDDESQDSAHFSQFSNRFANDFTLEYIEGMLAEIYEKRDPRYALPPGWTMNDVIPDVPNPLLASYTPPAEFVKWVDVHLGDKKPSKKGSWHRNSAAKSKTDRQVTITRSELYALYRENGGDFDRSFGMRGSWTPKSKFLLTMDKVDPTKGYEKGNLVIMLDRSNDAKFEYPMEDFLKWRDGVVMVQAEKI